ncbi:unnamed protein product [Diamesa hyperborea]
MPVHKSINRKILYAFRGWIGFVAFIDIGSAFRSYVEKRSFLSSDDTTDIKYIEGDFTVSRVLGIYCILKAFCLIQSTLYIHYKPVVNMGSCSLLITMVLYLSEALYFKSTTMNFYVIFPSVLNFLTLLGLYYIPKRLRLYEPIICDDENTQLLKQMNFKKRRLQQKENKLKE